MSNNRPGGGGGGRIELREWPRREGLLLLIEKERGFFF